MMLRCCYIMSCQLLVRERTLGCAPKGLAVSPDVLDRNLLTGGRCGFRVGQTSLDMNALGQDNLRRPNGARDRRLRRPRKLASQ